eukprot:SAG11_NODE_449_length_9392_cov_16.435381_11_plen_83_part_00
MKNNIVNNELEETEGHEELKDKVYELESHNHELQEKVDELELELEKLKIFPETMASPGPDERSRRLTHWFRRTATSAKITIF